MTLPTALGLVLLGGAGSLFDRGRGAAVVSALCALVDELASAGRGLVMVMGKGGVGKTTIAAAIAAELATRGHTVHLSTTDPAAHVASTRSSFVVLDTAPTGHTLLLLDTTGTYHRQMTATESGARAVPARIVTPLMRLRDPAYTKILLVTLAESTPVSEAARLQDDLRRAGIEPYAWVVNSSLAASGSADPRLRQRIAAELGQIDLVRSQHAQRIAIVPWVTEEPVGPARLLALAGRPPA
jgi:anion-transporting  ArsA/GET3 family ATPase